VINKTPGGSKKKKKKERGEREGQWGLGIQPVGVWFPLSLPFPRFSQKKKKEKKKRRKKKGSIPIKVCLLFRVSPAGAQY